MRPDLGRLGAAALPVCAIAAVVVFVGATLAVAGDTLGFDFLAYHAAAARVLEGQPLYDTSFEAAGGFGLFYYPPPFLPLILPFGALDATFATWTWIAILLLAFVFGVLILPVSRSIRWVIVLLAGVSWPFAYAIKLGQVGPLLFLAFAIGWRWLDRPAHLGASGAVGAAIKLQPGIILVWAVLTRRWRAAVIGGVVLAALSVAATLLAGFAAWGDFMTLISRVSDPIRTEHNLTPGAVAFQLGISADVAAWVQLTSMAAVVGLVLVAVVWGTSESSYLVVVIASQLLSPILWDHYAMLLLLPVAYLLSAGLRWAALIPLATATPLIGVTPPATYPVAFVATLVLTLVVGLRRPGTVLGREASFA